MKKIAFVLVLVVSIFGVSAFNSKTPLNSSLTIFYESSPGVFTEIPPSVTPCPQGTATQCVIEIDGEMKPLWADEGVTAYKKN